MEVHPQITGPSPTRTTPRTLALVFAFLLTAFPGHSQPDTARIDQLLKMGAVYVLRPGNEKRDLDSALLFCNQALTLSRQLASDKWINACLLLEGECYLEGDDLATGIACFQPVIEYYRRKADKRGEAGTWVRLAQCIGAFDNASASKKQQCLEHAAQLYGAIGDTLDALHQYKDLADLHLVAGKPEQAEQELLRVAAGYKAIHYRRMHYTYDLLRAANKLKGDLAREIFYTMEMVRSMESTDSLDKSGLISLLYGTASDSYTRAGMHDRALSCARLSLQGMLQHKTYNGLGYFYYNNMRLAVANLLALDSAKQALVFIAETIRRWPPRFPVQHAMVACAKGNCYTALGDYAGAEKQFSTLLDLFGGKLLLHREPNPTEGAAEDLLALGNFYLLTHRYEKADVLAKRLVPRKEDLLSLEQQVRIQRFQSRVDSCLGRGFDALRHYETYKLLTDSLYGVQKMVQIQELQIRYSTEQKDKDLRIQAGDIRLLTKQTQLQQAQADGSRLLRNMMIGGLLLLLLLTAVTWRRYQLKQRTNARLQKLLDENEWLMREIHHRVKNNLQVVMSLLNSQTAYMKDPAAISAVMESRHRVQAMSIIHQKLYRSAEVSSVDMVEYIGELVDYLQDSFDSRQKVDFHLHVSPITLDVSQAVPLGLILNEVITNSYKYAFPGSGRAAITLRLAMESPRMVRLFIGDNGRGLPPGIRFASNDHFGLSLIRGLSGDLDGHLRVCDDNGIGYYLSFTAMAPL